MATSGTVGSTSIDVPAHATGLQFYTYFHTRNDTGAVFYVGKGSKARAFDCDRNAYWKNIVKKCGHTVHIASRWATEAEAFEHEKFLILCFKDLGAPLANLTDGGEGTSGWVATEEFRVKTSASSKARWQDPDYKARVSASIRIGTTAEGINQKRTASIKEALASPEIKLKMSAAQKLLWQDPEHRIKILIARGNNKETDAEKSERLAKSARAMRTDAAKARTSAQSKAMWADPEFRVKMSAIKRTKK